MARLAAELSGSITKRSSPKPTKPKDLMRSVGKIERDDWNMKEIEKKILENRLGRPEPRSAEKVPKWDREQVSISIVVYNIFFILTRSVILIFY